MEVWRPVVGFEGRYEVSDQGRVRSLDRVVLVGGSRWGGKAYEAFRKGRMLRPGPGSHCYPTVVLGRDGGTRTVHSLVASAFLGSCPAGMEVMHRHPDRNDPRLDNLRYGTRTENNLQASADGNRRLKPDDIHQIRRRLAEGELGKDLAVEFGIGSSMVSNIKHRRQYAHV